MIKADKKPPKLKPKGAETRCLVPFALELAQQLRNLIGDIRTLTILKCFSALLDFYMVMSSTPFVQQHAKDACSQFCLHYGALNSAAEANGEFKSWVCKPKMHMMQEMAEMMSEEVGNPRLFWCYRDEDFMGWIAEVTKSRGGAAVCSTAPLRVLERFRALWSL